MQNKIRAKIAPAGRIAIDRLGERVYNILLVTAMHTFQGFSMEAYDFFPQIRFNNTKEFFDKHRAFYERELKKPLYDLTQDLAPTLLSIDPTLETRPVKCVARLRRSTLFAPHKPPYRDYLWASWWQREMDKSECIKFYFDMSFDSMGCGLGFYYIAPSRLDTYRKALLRNPEQARHAIACALQAGFTFDAPDYKRITVPDTLAEDLVPFYIKKGINFYLTIPISEQTASPALVNILEEKFRALAPFYQFIQDAQI